MIDKQDPPGSQRRLGRLPAVDERDRRFSMAAPRTERTFRNWMSPGDIWDQGNTSECVSYAANRWLAAHRVVNALPMSLHAFYKECQRNDEWPGEDYDGTSVRAAFKILKRLGYVERYDWAFEAEPVVRHILELGPVVVGTDWTESMFYPDRHGYIWPTGRIEGGHAWLVTAANRNRKNPDGTIGAVRCFNSWGAGWGSMGKAWVTTDTLNRLLAGLSRWPGEAAAALEIRVC
jgi:hypothetical protein